MNGKPSSPVLRGLGVSNGARLLDSNLASTTCDPVVWVFSTSGFHRFLATKPVSSETSKAERLVGSDYRACRQFWEDYGLSGNNLLA
jgi:hypothetical protein